MIRALVTGAGGFIGSHLVEHLLEEGWDVRALVHYNRDSNPGHLRGVDCEVVFGDVRDQDRLKRIATGCDIIFNLAAIVSIPSSYASPWLHLDVNTGGTLNALAAARWHGCRLVHMSTSEVLGTAQRVPQDEKHPLNPQSPYAASKLAAEGLCLSFDKSFDDCNVVVARCFNTTGPRQSLRAVLPNIIGQVLRGETEIKLGSLHAVRDLTDARDTVRGLRLLGESELRGKVIHIGSGKGWSLTELVDVVGFTLGKTLVPVLSEEYARPERSEVQRLICNARLAFGHLGWEPEVPLQNTIADIANYLRPRLDSLPTGRVL